LTIVGSYLVLLQLPRERLFPSAHNPDFGGDQSARRSTGRKLQQKPTPIV
jgi:hypothetical protein